MSIVIYEKHTILKYEKEIASLSTLFPLESYYSGGLNKTIGYRMAYSFIYYYPFWVSSTHFGYNSIL